MADYLLKLTKNDDNYSNKNDVMDVVVDDDDDENSNSIDSIDTEKESLPLVLRSLTGLVASHPPSQRILLEKGVLPILHQLELVAASKKQIGTLAENVINAILKEGGDKTVQDAMTAIRQSTMDEKKKKALAQREKLVADLNINSTSFEGMDDLEDEEGLVCMVCQEGYSFKPREMMGFYVFCKKDQLEDDANESGVSTVTHFKTIHINCHKNATRAEKSMAKPREEWEGATLRNENTKANNLFPILGDQVSEDEYSQAVEKYWVGAIHGRFQKLPSPRLRLLIHDLKLLIKKYSTEASFSIDSNGGGRESNSQMIPFMIQQGYYFAEQKQAQLRKTFFNMLTNFVNQKFDSTWRTANNGVDNCFYYAVMTLFFHPLQYWQAEKLIFLKHFLLVSANIPSSLSTISTFKSDDEIFKFVRCSLLMLLFIHQLHHSLKDGLPAVTLPATFAATAEGTTTAAATAAAPSDKPETTTTTTTATTTAKNNDTGIDVEKWVPMFTNKLREDYLDVINKCREQIQAYENEWLAFTTVEEFGNALEIKELSVSFIKDLWKQSNLIK